MSSHYFDRLAWWQQLATLFAQKPEQKHNEPMPPGYVTTKQAAALTGYSEQQIRDAIRSGVIKPEDLDRIGPMWLIREEAIKGFKPRPKGHQPGVSKR